VVVASARCDVPGDRVIEKKHSTKIGRSVTYIKGQYSYIRADKVRRFNIGPVAVLNNPPAGRDGCCSGGRGNSGDCGSDGDGGGGSASCSGAT